MRTALVLLCCGCAATPPARLPAVSSASGGDGDARWAQRGDEAELRAALSAWSGRTDDPEAQLRLARGFYFLADGHVQFDETRRAELADLYARGAEHAERGLALAFPAFADRRRAGDDVARASVELPAAAVPLLYWWAQNRGRWANEKGLATSIAQHRIIYPVMERIARLDETYWYAGAARYRAVVYAVAPPIAGGDLARSRGEFQAAIAQAPYFLETHVLLAVLYARKVGDRALFEDTLRFVLETPDDAIPGLEPELAVEKRKARLLLEDGF